MSTISFVSKHEIITDNDNFSVIIPTVHNKMELLDEYRLKLLFPSYFGFNWDALWDLLCDLQWISQEHIHIYHERLTLMPIGELKVFLDVVTDVCMEWDDNLSVISSRQKKAFHFYFNNKEKVMIQSIIEKGNKSI